MKGAEQFKEIIRNYLNSRAKGDELFRAKHETTERTIGDVVTYILNEVKQSECCDFSDMGVFSMAVHITDELILKIGKPVNRDMVVNRHIGLTEEERAEQKALALKRYQEEELHRLQACHSKLRTSRPQETEQPRPSLFDF